MTRFAPVPDKPNCVSSRADSADRRHRIEPLAATLAHVEAAMASIPRAELTTREDGYLHYVVTTALARFKDDLEFEIEGDVVHVRSASRVGYGDLGVNRRRVEAVRAALGEA